MSSDTRKLIYIAGGGRMGSTLLGNILGQIEGFFYGGEMHTLHRLGIEGEVPCSCGAPIKQCEVWHEVLVKGFGSIEAARTELRSKHPRQYGTSRLPAMMIRPLRRRYLERVADYRRALAKLYHAVYDTTGCRVIVDSSHKALYGAVLETIPGVDVYTVHLVRDPRGYVYSWMKPVKSQDPTKPTRSKSLLSSPVVVGPQWCLNNYAVERILVAGHPRAMRLRYEDFLDSPRDTIAEILKLVDEQPEKLPFVDSMSVELVSSHGCMGNQSRFKRGEIQLRLDDAWKSQMKRRNKWLVTALTWPMILRYGYWQN